MDGAALLQNIGRLPPQTIPVLAEHVGTLRRILGGKLVGVYVHGSVAMGGFNPAQSDLDYLAIVANPLDGRERQELSDAFLHLHGASGFRKGVEMSIVEARFAGDDFRYPTPYEFHMGSLDQVRHHGTAHDHEHLDPDLASHFTITRARGVCVYGKATADVFAPVPRKDFLASNWLDISVARESIGRDPVYTILNLCRTATGLRDHAVYSKAEGGALFLKGAGAFHALVETALSDYRNATVSSYDAAEALRFVDFMLAGIESKMLE
jgi:streptomycin 3"-adenylyltransferase